jgi:Flp pilus assembly protein TadD
MFDHHEQGTSEMPTKEEMYDEAIRLQQQGDLEQAVGKLQELVEQHADYALAHAALSKFYSSMERHDEAIEHAQKVCELEPEDPFSFDAMSLICQKAGRLAEAEHALREAWQARVAAQQKSSD